MGSRTMVTGGLVSAVPDGGPLLPRAFGRHEGGLARLATASGGRQGVHSLHVPRHRDEAPLTLDIVQPTQQELTEAHHRFDDPEHRFRGLLAQGIELLAFRRLQTVAHGFDYRRALRRRRCFGIPLPPAPLLPPPALREHPLPLCRPPRRSACFPEPTPVP